MGNTQIPINNNIVINKLIDKLNNLNKINNQSNDIHAKLFTLRINKTLHDTQIILNCTWDSIKNGSLIKNINIFIIIPNSCKFFKLKKSHKIRLRSNSEITTFFGKTKKYKYFEINDNEFFVCDKIYHKTCKFINKFITKEQNKLNIKNPYKLYLY